MCASIIVRSHVEAIEMSLLRLKSFLSHPQALNYPLKSVIFFRALLLALTHLWAQYDPEQPMNLYGFVTIPAKYLSYALLAMDLLQGGKEMALSLSFCRNSLIFDFVYIIVLASRPICSHGRPYRNHLSPRISLPRRSTSTHSPKC